MSVSEEERRRKLGPEVKRGHLVLPRDCIPWVVTLGAEAPYIYNTPKRKPFARESQLYLSVGRDTADHAELKLSLILFAPNK